MYIMYMFVCLGCVVCLLENVVIYTPPTDGTYIGYTTPRRRFSGYTPRVVYH